MKTGEAKATLHARAPFGCVMLSVGALVGSGSCSQAHTELGGDSSTHWLKRCDRDSECGPLSCVQTVCSKTCSSEADCTAFGTTAACAPAVEGVEESQICDRVCVGDRDCGSALVCLEGRCREDDASAISDAGPVLTDAMQSEPVNAAALDADAVDGDASLASTCDVPWYRCPDVCPQSLVLMGGGRSFGECQGDCRFELTLSPIIVLDVATCDDYAGTLTVHDTQGSYRVVDFLLTDAAWEEATQISLALEGAALDPVTGCPDCADGGDAWVTRGEDDFHYDYMSPPDALKDADALVQRLIDQARLCAGDDLKSCSTRDADGNAAGPACGPDPIATTHCTCSVPFEQLSELEGMVCDASCGSCSVPDSTCGATCVAACNGDGPAWKTFCTE